MKKPLKKKFPPIKKTMTPVIATTKMEIKVDGKVRKLTIKIGQPVQDVETATGLDWRCPFRILGLEQKYFYACGVDSFQALALALERVHLSLFELEGKHQAK